MDKDPRRAPRKVGGRMKTQEECSRPKPAVCRRLFADDDPNDVGARDNMFNQLSEEIGRNLDEAAKRYNFDFRLEVPLEGDWTWERIAPEDSSVPGSAPEPPVTGDPPAAPLDSQPSTTEDLRTPTVPQR